MLFATFWHDTVDMTMTDDLKTDGQAASLL